MLDICAPGYTKRVWGDHYWCLKWGTHTFPRMPLGRHGKSRDTGRAEVPLKHVRQLVTQFQIAACAAKFLPNL